MNKTWKALGIILSASAILQGCGGGDGTSTERPQALPTLPKVQTPAYELIQNSGPLVILMATDMHSTLYGTVMGNVSPDLIGAGFSLLALDLPCHGADAGTSSPLSCWRQRIEAGHTDMFRNFCAGLSAVLDKLGAAEVRVVGQSRGGYVAVTCAAYDRRIRDIAMLAPVTDLQRLSEFDDYTVDESVFGFDQYRPYILDRNILVRIGNADERVGTDAAVEWARSVNAELQVIDEPGHVPAEDGSTTQWLLDHS